MLVLFPVPRGGLLSRLPTTDFGGDADAVPDMHDATIDDRTTLPLWYGEDLDLHHVVEVLIHHEKRAAETLADVSAETPAPAGPDLN